MPIVFVDQPGGSYWKGWMDYAKKHLLGRASSAPLICDCQGDCFSLGLTCSGITRSSQSVRKL